VGVEPDQVIIRSTCGHPEVPDTVIDVHCMPREDADSLGVGAFAVSGPARVSG
jgi:hypothetical protein